MGPAWTICSPRVEDWKRRQHARKVGHPSLRAVGEASVPRAGWDATLVGGTVFSSARKSARQDRVRLPKPCPVVRRRRRSSTSPEHRRWVVRSQLAGFRERSRVLPVGRDPFATLGVHRREVGLSDDHLVACALEAASHPLTLCGGSLIGPRRTSWGTASTAPVLPAQGCGQRSVRRSGAFRSPECGPRIRLLALRPRKRPMASVHIAYGGRALR